jgi:hypothetical protein
VMYRFLRPAVHTPISLRIADQTFETNINRVAHWRLKNRCWPPVTRHRLGAAKINTANGNLHRAIMSDRLKQTAGRGCPELNEIYLCKDASC